MNKLAVISGATKGIGFAIAQKFAQQNFDVVICGRNQADIEKAKTFFAENHKNVQFFAKIADLSNPNDTLKFIQFILSLNRNVDVLVNNAGAYQPGKVHNEDEGVLEKMIETNLYSAYKLTRGLVQKMIEHKQGHIFTICSTASIIPYINGGSYCISKHALLGFSKVLREEMKEHNIRVTAILPGPTKTASWDGVDLPTERFIKSEDIAEAVFGAYSLSEFAVVEELLIRPQLGDI